jgi:predicted Zn-dependent peptidase
MISKTTLSNGLTVITEHLPHVESVAYELSIPGGVIYDAEGALGESLILGELTSRGAGTRDVRELSDAFDNAGIRHGEYAGSDRFVYRGSLLPHVLGTALELVADMVLRPTFPEEELEPIQSLLLQDIRSIPDSPSRQVMVELTARYLESPHGRPSTGTEEGISKATIESLKALWNRLFRPSRAVLSVAGACSHGDVIALAERLFGAWSGIGPSEPQFKPVKKPTVHHIESDSAQHQIALIFKSVKFGAPGYYEAKVANGILSGGMFGRLFIEVREKRGLCYSVYSRHSATKEYGAVVAYAGTTPERSQETLDVLLSELRKASQNITAEELERAKANLKAAVIIGEESAGARSGSNAIDFMLSGKIRTLSEIAEAISQVTLEGVVQYFEENKPVDITLVTLGKGPLTIK